ncbi:MAG: hypothetical protein V3W18_01625 [candidate division Zixibacteria bacterium]
MKIHNVNFSMIVVALCMFVAINAFAQWPDDPTQNFAISNQSGEQVIALSIAIFWEIS